MAPSECRYSLLAALNKLAPAAEANPNSNPNPNPNPC